MMIMKTLVLILTSLFIYVPLTFADIVVSVHDGDTLKTDTNISVRLFGIDAPELHPPPGTRALLSEDASQPFSAEAQTALSNWVLGKSVILECQHGRSHKRQVCTVSLENGEDVAANLIGLGLAVEDPHFSNRYQSIQTKAIAKGLGLWGLANGGERPWDYRRRLRLRAKASIMPLPSMDSTLTLPRTITQNYSQSKN
jgi:endonuclease YncB( thermonuclease family)